MKLGHFILSAALSQAVSGAEQSRAFGSYDDHPAEGAPSGYWASISTIGGYGMGIIGFGGSLLRSASSMALGQAGGNQQVGDTSALESAASQRSALIEACKGGTPEAIREAAVNIAHPTADMFAVPLLACLSAESPSHLEALCESKAVTTAAITRALQAFDGPMTVSMAEGLLSLEQAKPRVWDQALLRLATRGDTQGTRALLSFLLARLELSVDPEHVPAAERVLMRALRLPGTFHAERLLTDRRIHARHGTEDLFQQTLARGADLWCLLAASPQLELATLKQHLVPAKAVSHEAFQLLSEVFDPEKVNAEHTKYPGAERFEDPMLAACMCSTRPGVGGLLRSLLPYLSEAQRVLCLFLAVAHEQNVNAKHILASTTVSAAELEELAAYAVRDGNVEGMLLCLVAQAKVDGAVREVVEAADELRDVARKPARTSAVASKLIQEIVERVDVSGNWPAERAAVLGEFIEARRGAIADARQRATGGARLTAALDIYVDMAVAGLLTEVGDALDKQLPRKNRHV